MTQHPTNAGHSVTVLATPPVQALPPEVKKAEEVIAEKAKPPTWTFVYYFRDGGVTKLVDTKPDSILFEQAYLVMVSVPARHKARPYVEIIKMEYGRGSLILSANVPVQQSQQGGNDGTRGTQGIRR